jgi:hypothetical protein
VTAESPEENGTRLDSVVYQDRLDAIGFTEAFMRSDRAYYDAFLATRDPYRLAHALAYVAAMLAADCAAFGLEDAGEEVPDDPRDPKFLAAARDVMDGLRERALSALNVPAEEAARMRDASKGEPPGPDAGSCPACGGALRAPHFHVWHGVSMNVCNACSGDRALMDATAARLRSERAGGQPASSPRRHLRGI